MDSLKTFTIKISTSETKSSETEEEPRSYYYIMKVPFPDEDCWCYVKQEGGIWDGELRKFPHKADAESFAKENDIVDFILEKIYD